MRGVKPEARADAKALARVPRVPAWLSTHAKAEWKRVAPILVARRVLTDADLGTLEGYCVATGTVRACEVEIARDGVTIDTPTGRKRHPATGIQSAALQSARLAANELGLTPVSRSRPAIRTDEDRDDDSPLGM